MYFTGDGANRDEDGDYTITGRMDDVINISGHRLGTAEIEDCMVTHSLLLLFCYKIFSDGSSYCYRGCCRRNSR